MIYDVNIPKEEEIKLMSEKEKHDLLLSINELQKKSKNLVRNVIEKIVYLTVKEHKNIESIYLDTNYEYDDQGYAFTYAKAYINNNYDGNESNDILLSIQKKIDDNMGDLYPYILMPKSFNIDILKLHNNKLFQKSLDTNTNNDFNSNDINIPDSVKEIYNLSTNSKINTLTNIKNITTNSFSLLTSFVYDTIHPLIKDRPDIESIELDTNYEYNGSGYEFKKVKTFFNNDYEHDNYTDENEKSFNHIEKFIDNKLGTISELMSALISQNIFFSFDMNELRTIKLHEKTIGYITDLNSSTIKKAKI